jgi:prevent-host-death family protein
MDLKKDVIPVTELKSRTKQILERVMKTGEPVLVTQKGHSVVMIVDIESFQRQERKLRVLEKIAKGEKEILEGQGIAHSQAKAEVMRWGVGEK